MTKGTTPHFWGEEFGRNSFVPLWWLQWFCLVTGQYFLNGLFVSSYAGPIHLSFSLYYVVSSPWLLALFYYLFIMVISLFVLLISTSTVGSRQGFSWPGEGCNAKDARPPAAAPAPPHWGSWLGLQVMVGSKSKAVKAKKGLPEPTKKHGKHSVRLFPGPSETKVETMSEIK